MKIHPPFMVSPHSRAEEETNVFKVSGYIRGKEATFSVEPGESLLSAVLRSRKKMDHVCKVGLCGMCQVKVVEGVENLSEPTEAERQLLDEVPLSDAVRLACQAQVTGPIAFIDLYSHIGNRSMVWSKSSEPVPTA